MDVFYERKIVFPAIMSNDAPFAIDNDGHTIIAPGNTITGNIHYDNLLLYLTTIGYWALRRFYMGGGIEGELKVNRLQLLPVPPNIDKLDTIDKFYAAFGFSESEINLISSSLKP